MILRFLLFVFALSATAARAETVRVLSGEHSDFTRLVMEFDGPVGWQVGRTVDGYELRVDAPDLSFDVSGVFDIIPRDRLAAIWVDPRTSTLRLGLACDCHAIPFAYRPNIVVIDLRSGPAPQGSSFELSLGGASLPALATAEAPRPRARPAPRASLQIVELPKRPAVVDPTILFPSTATPEMEQTRADLLQQFGRAASAGLIEVEDPVFPAPDPATRIAADSLGVDPLGVEVRPGARANPANVEPEGLGLNGEECRPDAALDVASWGDGRPFVEQVAEARGRLLGEFDRPDPASVAGYVQLLLHFGFGAEARNAVETLAPDHPDAELWRTLALAVDGERPIAAGPFAGQSACPGAAALWAALTVTEPGPFTNEAAQGIRSAFSALPVGLRRHLGPGLAERLLAAGEVPVAQAIRDAIWRAPGPLGEGARVIDARLEASRGNVEAAAKEFAGVAAQGGDQAAEAVIALVDTRIALGQPVEATTVTEIAAHRHEREGTDLVPALLRAEMLARASSNDVDAALSLAEGAVDPESVQDMWQVIADLAPDSAILLHAVLAPEEPRPTDRPATALRIGERLLGLGLAEAALRWLPVPAATEEGRVLLAQAELARGDARAALRQLAGLAGPQVEAVRAAGLLQLNDLQAAATAFEAAANPAGAATARWQSGDWSVAQGEADPRAPAVWTLLAPVTAGLPGAEATLAGSRALLDESTRTREAVDRLLAEVAAPEP